MTSWKWLLGWGLVLCAACTSASGALGPQGYEQSLTKYRLDYADATRQKFLPDDWMLDNYTYNPSSRKWSEKKGDQYRAVRHLDEDGDGTISSSERKIENIFDLRFVNSRDNAVIWLKVHPLLPSYASVDLEVILDDYADGLEGSGLFEQSTLFGLAQDKARHFTTFVVKKEPTALGALPAIRGVIEIADVEKLRLDATHRDSKSELVFAKVTYREKLGINRPAAPRWPVVTEIDKGSALTVYYALRTALLVIGYYDDAARFESHLADLHALLGQIAIPASAIPPDASPVILEAMTPRTASAAPIPSATPAIAAVTSAAAPASAGTPSASSAAPALASTTAPSAAAGPTSTPATKSTAAPVAPSTIKKE